MKQTIFNSNTREQTNYLKLLEILRKISKLNKMKQNVTSYNFSFHLPQIHGSCCSVICPRKHYGKNDEYDEANGSPCDCYPTFWGLETKKVPKGYDKTPSPFCRVITSAKFFSFHPKN